MIEKVEYLNLASVDHAISRKRSWSPWTQHGSTTPCDGEDLSMKLHKKDIARRQIETAIDIFAQGSDFLSVVTLAGAGEEILGDLLNRSSKKNMIGYLKELDIRLSGGRQFKIINQEANGFRNNLKHARDPNEDEIDVADSREHAIAMIARALTNYGLLEGQLTDKMSSFHEWLLNQGY